MSKKRVVYSILSAFIILSFGIKVFVILKYRNLLTLSSDDQNYVKSAVVLLQKGILTYQNFNEPTVFIMPLYPAFVAGIFKIFGYGLAGLQAVRIIQSVLSCITILYAFMIAKTLFNEKVALISAFLISFYPPNIITPGYLLTETLFTTFLYILIYYSLRFADELNTAKLVSLGTLWALATLCRPTMALYPVLFFLYFLVHFKLKLIKMVKLGIVMALTFALIMAPWWVRNFFEYGEFIPLSASGGNPMLQGTYIDYKQTPENIVYYKIGKNAFETNKTEMEVAKKRIASEFKRDFRGYLRWYTIGKTLMLWGTVFYWKEFLGISTSFVIVYHHILLLGFAGIFILMFNKFGKYLLPVLVVLYFNIIHCLYMAFDRYAFPIMPILSIFSAFFLFQAYTAVRRKTLSVR